MCFIFIYVFRVPISNNAIERNLDIDLVHKVLEKNYVVYVPASNDETHERDVIKHEDLWEILGVNKPSQESVTSSQLEMEQFMSVLWTYVCCLCLPYIFSWLQLAIIVHNCS